MLGNYNIFISSAVQCNSHKTHLIFVRRLDEISNKLGFVARFYVIAIILKLVLILYLSSAISATIIGITTNTAPPTKPVKKRDAYK